MSPRTRWSIFGALLAVCLACTVLAGSRLAQRDQWLSAPHRMPWFGPDGSALEVDLNGPTSCRGADIHFRVLLDGSFAWLPCNDDATSGLARVSLEQRRVDFAWHYPSDWRVQWTLGLLPTADGGLARVVALKNGIGVAVSSAERGRWQLPPTRITPAQHARFLAMAWQGALLELIFADPEDGVSIWSIAADAAPRARKISGATLCGERCLSVEAAYRSRDGSWHLLANTADPQLGFADVSESGSRRKLRSGHLTRYDIDALSWGSVAKPADWVLDVEGKLAAAEPGPPWSRGRRLFTHRFVRGKHDRAQWLYAHELDAPQAPAFEQVGDRLIDVRYEQRPERGGTPGTPAWEDEQLVVEARKLGLLGPERSHAPRAVARIDECGALAREGTLARLGSDYIVFEPSGCYVTLDDALARKDAWGLRDHLRMRGSMYLGWNEPSHFFTLLFVLFAPVFVGLTALLAKRRPPTALAIAVVVAVASVWLLVRLWPLLR